MAGVGDCMPDSMAFDVGSAVVHSSNIQRSFSRTERKRYVVFSHYFAVTAA